MKQATRVILGSVLVCLAFSMAFAGTATATQIIVPTLQAGDYLMYYSQTYSSQPASTRSTASYTNGTSYWNISSISPVVVWNNTYTAYILNTFSNSTTWTWNKGNSTTNSSVSVSQTISNGTSYINTTNMATVWSIQFSNATTPTGYTWTENLNYYHNGTPSIRYQYPFDVGNSWYNNNTYFSIRHTIRSPPYTSTWRNRTSTSSSKYVVIDDETLGTYDCLMVNATTTGGGPTPIPTQTWISQAAGGQEVKTYQETSSTQRWQYSYKILVQGIIGGIPINGVPIPTPIPPVFETTVLLIPIVGVMAVFLIVGRRK